MPRAHMPGRGGSEAGMLTFEPWHAYVAAAVLIYLSLGMATVTWVLRRKRKNILSRNRLLTLALVLWPLCLYFALKELK